MIIIKFLLYILIPACNNNHYGEDCRKPCNCESQCDAVSGFCSRSCVAGKMKDNAGVCSVSKCQ